MGLTGHPMVGVYMCIESVRCKSCEAIIEGAKRRWRPPVLCQWVAVVIELSDEPIRIHILNQDDYNFRESHLMTLMTFCLWCRRKVFRYSLLNIHRFNISQDPPINGSLIARILAFGRPSGYISLLRFIASMTIFRCMFLEFW